MNKIYESINKDTTLVLNDEMEYRKIKFGIINNKHYKKLTSKGIIDQMIFSYDSLRKIYLWLLNPIDSLYIKCDCFCEVLEISLFDWGESNSFANTIDFEIRGCHNKKFCNYFEMTMTEVEKFKTRLRQFLVEKNLLNN